VRPDPATLVEEHGEVKLTVAIRSIKSPTPLSVAQGRIDDRIASSPTCSPATTASAVGPSCRGGTAFSITREAIALPSALGCNHSPGWSSSSTRMPPRQLMASALGAIGDRASR
jgi:hypothetical protein